MKTAVCLRGRISDSLLYKILLCVSKSEFVKGGGSKFDAHYTFEEVVLFKVFFIEIELEMEMLKSIFSYDFLVHLRKIE